MQELPAPKINTLFTSGGEEIVEYTGSDFGNEPDWDKTFLVDKGIIIRGLSEEQFKQDGSAFPPARSVLYNLLEDDPQPEEAWGMFFTDYGIQEDGKEHKDTSTVIKQVRHEFKRNGGRPFLTTIEYVVTDAKANRGYWTLKRFVRNATPKDGKGK